MDKNREYKFNIIIPEGEKPVKEINEFNDFSIIENPNSNSNTANQNKKILKINAICISPTGEEIAFYCGTNSTIYLYTSKLAKFSPKKIKLSIDKIKQG